MIINTKPADLEEGGTAFNGPCSQACFAVNSEGECIADCQHYKVKNNKEYCIKNNFIKGKSYGSKN